MAEQLPGDNRQRAARSAVAVSPVRARLAERVAAVVPKRRHTEAPLGRVARLLQAARRVSVDMSSLPQVRVAVRLAQRAPRVRLVQEAQAPTRWT